MLKAWSPSPSECDCVLSRSLEVINLNSALIQSGCGPYEKRTQRGTAEAQRRKQLDTRREATASTSRGERLQETLTLLTPWSWTSSLPNCEEINFRCLSPPVYSFPGGSDGKGPACNAGDLGSVPGLGRCPGGGLGNPLQDSCLENPMDRGAWRAAVCGVAKSRTRLSDYQSMVFCPESTSRLTRWVLLPGKDAEPKGCYHSAEDWDYKSQKTIKGLPSTAETFSWQQMRRMK